MTPLRFDVRMVAPAEPAARHAVDAARRLEAGDRADAERLFREAAAMPHVHASSGINLAALGIGLGEMAQARALAQRAVALDQRSADAWVNLGIALWHGAQPRDAVQATVRALSLAPTQESAAWNLALMLRAANRHQQARDALALALQHHPGSARLHRAMAEASRLLGQADATRRHALVALSLLPPRLFPVARDDAPPAPGNAADEAAASARVQQALFAARDALDAAGLPCHLIAGTLLAIHRDDRLFPHDKDIDLGLPWDCDRDAVAAAFAQGFRPVLRADDPRGLAAREWAMGFVHEASGIGVDLLFARERDGMVRFELGWPDRLACEFPAYPLQALHWAGRDWQVPAPPEHYLDALYGPDWNGPAVIRGFDRRWFDTQVSNPSRTAESLPRAINLGLLRLLKALESGQWGKADALCTQLLAHGPLPEVEAVAARLRGVAGA